MKFYHCNNFETACNMAPVAWREKTGKIYLSCEGAQHPGGRARGFQTEIIQKRSCGHGPEITISGSTG
ncbi:MAG: hypothetical protein D6813_07845 [Calditrichaeota bacterium]|nr:MAG: hypothetical protein D6813_07845 [Calditrichota bacterium]